jgi:hypothetical protein
MNYIILDEFIHPETGELYKLKDKVVIYQGRFGHNNILEINTIFKVKNDEFDYIYVTDRIYTQEDWLKKWPHCPQGTFANSIKRKITNKQIKEIDKARHLTSIYG